MARTLAVLIFEFKGYQSTFETRCPSPDRCADLRPARLAVPLAAERHRVRSRRTASKRADEMRDQLLGVLREVTAAVSAGER